MTQTLQQFAGLVPRVGEALFEFFASLRLAVIVVIALIAALATGAAVESRAGVAVARAHVYQSPLFLVLLALLALNVMAAALIRYPWSRGQIGMVVTHVGIELLLAGALVGSRYGLDGQIHLTKGHSVSSVQLEDDRLIVSEPGVDGAPIGYEFDLKLWPACDWSGRWPIGRRSALPLAGDAQFVVTDWAAGADAKQPRTLVLDIDFAGHHYQQPIEQGGSTAVDTPLGPVRLAYASQERELPFEIALADTQDVPAAPGDPADPRRFLVFTAADGEVSRQTVRVNQPASFRGFNIYIGSLEAAAADAPISLNIRSDPGRWLKIGGSGLIVAGTFSLFAHRHVGRRHPRVSSPKFVPLAEVA